MLTDGKLAISGEAEVSTERELVIREIQSETLPDFALLLFLEY